MPSPLRNLELPAMSLFSADERRAAIAISELAYCNPFTPRRIELERIALGEQFDEEVAAWNLQPQERDDYPNVHRVVRRAESLARAGRGRLQRGRTFADGEEELLRDL